MLRLPLKFCLAKTPKLPQGGFIWFFSWNKNYKNNPTVLCNVVAFKNKILLVKYDPFFLFIFSLSAVTFFLPFFFFHFCFNIFFFFISHPATRHRDAVKTYLCTCQQRCRYVSNETPNYVSMERRQGVSVVSLHDVLLKRRNDVSVGLKEVRSVRLQDVWNKSQMKHPMRSRW